MLDQYRYPTPAVICTTVEKRSTVVVVVPQLGSWYVCMNVYMYSGKSSRRLSFLKRLKTEKKSSCSNSNWTKMRSKRGEKNVLLMVPSHYPVLESKDELVVAPVRKVTRFVTVPTVPEAHPVHPVRTSTLLWVAGRLSTGGKMTTRKTKDPKRKKTLVWLVALPPPL